MKDILYSIGNLAPTGMCSSFMNLFFTAFDVGINIPGVIPIAFDLEGVKFPAYYFGERLFLAGQTGGLNKSDKILY